MNKIHADMKKDGEQSGKLFACSIIFGTRYHFIIGKQTQNVSGTQILKMAVESTV
jgi:hypothetical protein